MMYRYGHATTVISNPVPEIVIDSLSETSCSVQYDHIKYTLTKYNKLTVAGLMPFIATLWHVMV